MKTPLLLAAALAVAGMTIGSVCEGCHPDPAVEPTITETVANAKKLTEYKLAVGECRKLNVDAGDRSLAIFDRCLEQVDADFCQTRGFRCDR